MDKIKDNLYIGNCYEAIHLFKNMGEFKAILSIGTEFVEDAIYKEYFLPEKDFPHLIIEMWDRSKNIKKAIDTTNKFIDDNIDNGKLFVHCAAGVSRSPSIVFAYLLHKGMQPIEAFELLTSTRTIAYPYVGFIKDILFYYNVPRKEIHDIMVYIDAGVSK